MTFATHEVENQHFNPLDSVHELALLCDWECRKIETNRIAIDLEGRWCDFSMVFAWDDDTSCLQFACQYDVKIPASRIDRTHRLLALINSRLWIGHFEICETRNCPIFRYGLCLRGVDSVSSEQVEDMVETALSECERFFPAFQFAVWGDKTPDEALAAAMLDTVGEA